MKRRRGFTLIELMVVILIVSLLAAVAIPILRGRIEAAKWSEGKAIMGSIATAIQAYIAEKGFDPLLKPANDDWVAIGFETQDLEGTYFKTGDFGFTVASMGTADGDQPQFSISCESGSKDGGPQRPDGGYVLQTMETGGLEFVVGTTGGG